MENAYWAREIQGVVPFGKAQGWFFPVAEGFVQTVQNAKGADW